MGKRCIVAVAYGEKYEMMGDLMIESFLKYNKGWEAERYYGSNIKVPVVCMKNGITPFNACEIGRWVAMRELLDKYDEVLYCDNDIRWYGKYKPLKADVVLSPHYITNEAKYTKRHTQFYDGVFNEGIVYVKGDDGKKACDFIASEIAYNSVRFTWKDEKVEVGTRTGMIWIQELESYLPEIGLDCKIDNNPGANVAFWNLVCNERKIIIEDNGKYIVQCGNKKCDLQSFHFSSGSLHLLKSNNLAPLNLIREYTESIEAVTFKTLYKGVDDCFTMRDANSFNGLKSLIETNFHGKSNLTMIEIGSYQGESTQLFLSTGVFSKIYCIDGWANGYDDADKASYTADRAERAFDKRFANDNRVVKIKGFSQDVVDKIPDGVADFLYVDGCHTYDAVKLDLSNYSRKVKSDGVLAGHDYNTNDFPGVVKAVEEFLGHAPERTYCDTSWSYKKKNI